METDDKKLPIIPFSSFTEEAAKRAFKIKQKLAPCDFLEAWETRAVKVNITDEEQKKLDRLQYKLKLYVRGWNEDELKVKFIVPLIEEVNFDDF